MNITKELVLLSIILSSLLVITNASSTLAGGNWTSLIFNYQNSRNQFTSTINSSNIANLTQAWFIDTGQYVTSTPLVLNGTVYFADWGGNVYAANITTGKIIWEVNLNSKLTPNPPSNKVPITSTLAIAYGKIYVADGLGSDSIPETYLIALNQANGNVIWIDDNTTFKTTMNSMWGSPTVYNGKVYIGTSGTNGPKDNAPYKVGAIYAVNASTGNLMWRFTTSIGSTGGAGVWSTPVVDPVLDAIYFGTGSASSNVQTTNDLYAYSMISLNATTGKKNWIWQEYGNTLVGDLDFGSTANLFSIVVGSTTYNAIGLGNKDGYYYIMNRVNGLLLEKYRIGTGGNGGGIVGIGGFTYPSVDKPKLFIPSYYTPNSSVSGVVEALLPSGNTVVWKFYTPGDLVGSLTLIPGAALFGDRDGNLYAVNTITGSPIFSKTYTNTQLDAGITVAEGYALVATSFGASNVMGVYALKPATTIIPPTTSTTTVSTTTTTVATTTTITTTTIPPTTTIAPPLPAVSISSPSNAIIDVGQWETLTATVSNDIGPYTYNFLLVNSVTPSEINNNGLFKAVAASTYTYTYVVNNNKANVNSPIEGNIVLTNSNGISISSAYSSTYIVTLHPIANAPIPTNLIITKGQSVLLKSNTQYGTIPYTYQWYTSSSGNPNCNPANAIGGSTGSSYVATPATSNSYEYLVTDNASIPVAVCSSASTISVVSKGGNWTSLIFDLNDSRYQANSTINSSNIANITQKWFIKTSNSVTSTPIVLNGNVYFTDWGGYVYSANIVSGNLNWKVNPNGNNISISDTPTLVNGVMYIGVGLGEPKLYALSQSTGKTLWNTTLKTYDNAVYGSPTLYNNVVYIGVSVYGGPKGPVSSSKGAIFAINATTGKQIWTVNTMIGSTGGAGVWSTPVVDPVLNSIYFGTGSSYSTNASASANLHSYSVFSLNLSTGKTNWIFAAHSSRLDGGDEDFGSSANLFKMRYKGITYNAVGIGSKDGYYYVLNRINGALIEKTKVSSVLVVHNLTGYNGGIVGLAGFIYKNATNPEVFISSNNQTTNGSKCCGILEAYYPSSNTIAWNFTMTGSPVGSVTLVPGSVITGDRQGNLYALNTTTGKVLLNKTFDGEIDAGVTSAGGYLIVPLSFGAGSKMGLYGYST